MSIWNTVTATRAGLACLAGVALVLPASLAQATYGPKTTIGTNYTQWSDTQSPDAVDEAPCSGTRCFILFQRVPQRKNLIVEHVSCRVSVGAGGLRYGYLGARKGQTFPDRFTYLLPVNPSDTNWVVSNPVMHLLESNERPYLVLRASAASDNWSVACSISGRLK